jgi:hypothetical protein
MCGLHGHTYNECLVFFEKPGMTKSEKDLSRTCYERSPTDRGSYTDVDLGLEPQGCGPNVGVGGTTTSLCFSGPISRSSTCCGAFDRQPWFSKWMNQSPYGITHDQIFLSTFLMREERD